MCLPNTLDFNVLDKDTVLMKFAVILKGCVGRKIQCAKRNCTVNNKFNFLTSLFYAVTKAVYLARAMPAIP